MKSSNISVDRLGGRLNFPITVLKDEKSMKLFLKPLDWVVTKIVNEND